MELELMLNDLIDHIKEHEIFKEYELNNNKLFKPEVNDILKTYQVTIEEYNELKKFSNYINLDDIETRLKNIRKLMLDNVDIQNYQYSYNQLNNYLNEITTKIYGDISDKIIMSHYRIK